MSIDVHLEWYELATASAVGARRHIEALRQGRRDQHGFEGDAWGVHIEGACGEAAVARELGIYWPASVNTFKEGHDVGPYQIRTRSETWHDLIVRRNDPDDQVFVLVVGKAPDYSIVGWMLGSDAKRDEWLQTHGARTAAYFVPQGALGDPSELRVWTAFL